jgi:hypothetical protein
MQAGSRGKRLPGIARRAGAGRRLFEQNVCKFLRFLLISSGSHRGWKSCKTIVAVSLPL